MTIGTGIFLSTFLVVILALYGITKDRWSWKKIITRTILLFVSIGVISGAGFWGYNKHQSRAILQTGFAGIKLSDSKADVLLKRGKPEDMLQANEVEYPVIFFYPDVEVKINNNKVINISQSDTDIHHRKVSGLGIGSAYNEIIDKFGKPTSTHISEDNLRETLEYENYNLTFAMEKKTVVTIQVFDPKLKDEYSGLYRLANEGPWDKYKSKDRWKKLSEAGLESVPSDIADDGWEVVPDDNDGWEEVK